MKLAEQVRLASLRAGVRSTWDDIKFDWEYLTPFWVKAAAKAALIAALIVGLFYAVGAMAASSEKVAPGRYPYLSTQPKTIVCYNVARGAHFGMVLATRTNEFKVVKVPEEVFQAMKAAGVTPTTFVLLDNPDEPKDATDLVVDAGRAGFNLGREFLAKNGRNMTKDEAGEMANKIAIECEADPNVPGLAEHQRDDDGPSIEKGPSERDDRS